MGCINFISNHIFHSQADDTDKSHFQLKQARQKIHSYLEHFISVNHLGSTAAAGLECSDDSGTHPSVVALDPPNTSGWNEFVSSLREHCSEPGTLDTNGRYMASLHEIK